MQNTLQKIARLTASSIAVAAMACASAGAAPVLGNLNDGVTHTSSTTGWWSLFVNAGDLVTVTARRLNPVDIWAVAFNGANGTGTQIAAGDDELSAYVGGSYGDPRFSFTAATTGEYSVGVFRCCSVNTVETISYFVGTQGATGVAANAVPLPGTVALLGAGMLALIAQRRRPAAARGTSSVAAR